MMSACGGPSPGDRRRGRSGWDSLPRPAPPHDFRARRSLSFVVVEIERAGLHLNRVWEELTEVLGRKADRMSKKATARKKAQKTKQAEARVKPTKKKTKKAAWPDEP